MFTIISDNTSEAAYFLKLGKAVAVPTETVYGLAANIFDEQAVRSIFELKERPMNNPLIVHVHSYSQLSEIARNIPEAALRLAEKFWPGPLTLVLEKTSNVPDLITAGKPTVGVRMPNHGVTLDLLKQLPFPLAAPSANPFMRISPTNPERVFEYFQNKIPFILDGGECINGIESTIVGFRENTPILYRLGAISVEEIEEVVGELDIVNNETMSPDAPGMMKKHYSPRTKLIVTSEIENQLKLYEGKKVGLLCFSESNCNESVQFSKTLSQSRNLDEAAHNLYEHLQELDNAELDIIIAEKMPNLGLGKSINDRLMRAAN